MSYFILDSRCRHIMEYLYLQDGYQLTKVIEEVLFADKVNIKYSLSKINTLLTEQGLGVLDRKHGGSIRLTPEQKKWWKKVSETYEDLDYVFTYEERVALIICQLIIARRTFSVDAAAQLVRVSRNTIFTDIKNMKELLNGYKVRMKYNFSHADYTLIGDEFVIRSLLLHQYSILAVLIEQGFLELLEDEKHMEYMKKIQLLQKHLHIEYAPGVVNKLTILLFYIYSGYANQPLFDNEQLSDVSKSREYEAVTNYFPDISDTEKKYLTCQLLGTRLKEYLFQSESGRNQSYHSANELVICFEKLTRVYVEDRNDLITDLASHISESVYRHKYGMMFQEQMSKPIRRRHKELFSTIRLIVNDLHGDIGYPMNDDETARLTIIFFNHLQQMTFKSEHVPTILIVAQKTKQNETLPNKIMNDFPMLQIQKVYTVQEFEKSQDIGEFLISTLPLHTDSIYALIDENLDEVSRNIITRTCAKYRFGRSLEDIEEFMQKIEPCIKRDKYIQVKAELVSFLFGRVYTLCDILLPEYVQTRLPANHWEDAIRAAANPILAKRAINGDYVNDIIASISAYGSYSFISKDVYLAHAEINGNVNQLSLGISTFSNPIIFPDGKQARMIFILCPIDKSSHFDSFKEIIRICGQKGVIESMIHADSPDALMNIVLKKL